MEYKFKIDEEHLNLLQRLGLEVDTKVFLLKRMFEDHKDDKDDSLFRSVPFQHYQKLFEEDFATWQLAKDEFLYKYVRPWVIEKTGMADPTFTWLVDFSTGECIVVMAENE